MKTNWYNQEWYRSWAMWLAIAALVAFVVKSIWHEDIAPWLDNLMNILLPLLVGFGIVNNPNTSVGWVVPNGEVYKGEAVCVVDLTENAESEDEDAE